MHRLILSLLLAASVAVAFPGDSPDVNTVGIQGVKSWAASRTSWAESMYTLPRQRSPQYWPQRVVYSIQIDRFNNGDFTNDDKNVPDDQRADEAAGRYGNLPNWRHGGDLEGIRRRLPYLAKLGVGSLWLTPVLRHTGAYHGYCMADPTEIDPGFGTPELLRQLVREAHDAGIMVVMDIVVNHMCDMATVYSQQPDHYGCANDADHKFWTGTPGEPFGQGQLNFSSHFFPPFRTPFFFNRCGTNSDADMRGQDPAAVYGDFVAGMFDFDTRNYDFQEIFTELHKFWVAFADVDGYRLDAAKHVTEDFLAYFSTEIRRYAAGLGKTNFFVVGEVAASPDWEGRRLGKMFSNPANPDDHGNVPAGLTTRLKLLKDRYLGDTVNPYPGLTSIYDFSASGISRDAFKSKVPPSNILSYFLGDAFSTIAGQVSNPFVFWTHLEIHDWPRFLQDTPSDGGRAYVALGYLLAFQGTPIIYYGLEQGLNGNCGPVGEFEGAQQIRDDCGSFDDSRKRQDFFPFGPYRLGSAIAEIDAAKFIGPRQYPGAPLAWTEDAYLNMNNYLVMLVRRMLRLRATCPPLYMGQTSMRQMDSYTDGLIVFSRLGHVMEVVVVVNMKGQDNTIQKIKIDNALNFGKNGQKYVGLMDSRQVGYVGFEGSEAYLYFPGSGMTFGPRSVSVLVLEAYMGAKDVELDIPVCKDGVEPPFA